LNRFDVAQCLASTNDVEKLKDFVISSYERNSNHLIHNSNECVKSTSRVALYWQMMSDAYSDPSDRHKQIVFKKPALYVLLAILAVLASFTKYK
jgi:hypothetical protein